MSAFCTWNICPDFIHRPVQVPSVQLFCSSSFLLSPRGRADLFFPHVSALVFWLGAAECFHSRLRGKWSNIFGFGRVKGSCGQKGGKGLYGCLRPTHSSYVNSVDEGWKITSLSHFPPDFLFWLIYFYLRFHSGKSSHLFFNYLYVYLYAAK